jgi:hypothetical protein
VRKLFLKDQLRCGQFTPAECGQINWRMHFKNIKSDLKQDHKPFLICNPIFRLKKMKVYEEPIDIFYSF